MSFAADALTPIDGCLDQETVKGEVDHEKVLADMDARIMERFRPLQRQFRKLGPSGIRELLESPAYESMRAFARSLEAQFHFGIYEEELQTGGALVVVERKDSKGSTASKKDMQRASRQRMSRMSQDLGGAAGLVLTQTNEKNRTPLHSAAIKGNDKMAKVILMQPAGIATMWEKDRDGMSPIMWASFLGHLPVVQLLCAAEAKEQLGTLEDTDTEHEMTCLHWAALGGHQDVVEYLIKQEQGQDLLMTPDEKDRTPLHLAAHKGHEEVCRSIINGAPVGIALQKNREQLTALHMAVRREHVKTVDRMVHELPAGRIALDSEDPDGLTALEVAIAGMEDGNTAMCAMVPLLEKALEQFLKDPSFEDQVAECEAGEWIGMRDREVNEDEDEDEDEDEGYGVDQSDMEAFQRELAK